MAKPNYNYARRQKELTRKARQQEKRKDKLAATAAPVEIVAAPGESVAAGIGPASGSGA